MEALTDVQRTALLTGYCLASGYYLVSLYAAWVHPALQRFWLFRPRWRGGIKASRFGVTTQAIFAFSLSAFGAVKMYDHPWAKSFGVICLLSVGLLAAGWIADNDNNPGQSD